MSLSPGTRIGVYEITAPLGVGGMGEVYRAKDSRLKREVALKVLPADVANDRERLARFQREAEVLASLNHPNIAQIYGLEDGALVMELVEGEDLAERLKRGAIPLDEALPIAKQIAEALEAAHEQGIIHRDLKPANVKVRPDGTVKVLDFGLAKALDEPKGSSPRDLENSPTITSPAMTMRGMILGTAAYMSPEQAAGKPVDKRSDLWAFGVVLLEMLTGQRVFEGETVSHVIAAVLTKAPDWTALPAATPAPIRTLLRRCLEKERRRRLADASDARLEIEEAINGPTTADTPTATRPPARVWRWAFSSAVATALVSALVAWSVARPEPRPPAPLIRLDVDLGADVALRVTTIAGGHVAISPDGTRLAYVSGAPPRLFTRRLDQSAAVELPGTTGAANPFFSPDGRWVGFAVGATLNKMPVDGGAVVPLGQVGGSFGGASWGADDSIVASRFSGGLVRIGPAGDKAETLIAPQGDELGLLHPQVLPGGGAVLFAVDRVGPVSETTIEVVTIADRSRKVLVRGGAVPRYVSAGDGTGYLVYVRESTLFAVPFDLATLEIRGAAVAMFDDVADEGSAGAGQFNISPSGTLVYQRSAGGGRTSERLVQWVDRSGTRRPIGVKPAVYRQLALAPDGKRIALSAITPGQQDIWVYDPQRDTMNRVTFDRRATSMPRWARNGRHLVFTSANDLWQVPADGSSAPQLLLQSSRPLFPSDFSPDGKWLAYNQEAQGMLVLPIEDDGTQLKAGTPVALPGSANPGARERMPAFSPDGRWLAYVSNESGTDEVYVRSFTPAAPGQGGRWQVSNDGGEAPRWSAQPPRLMYRSGDRLMSVAYSISDGAFAAEKPAVWIDSIGGAQWDLTPEGERVAVIVAPEFTGAPTADRHVVFVMNFLDELRTRVPVSGQQP